MDDRAAKYRIRLARRDELPRLREVEDRAGTMFSGLGLIEEAHDVSFPPEDLITLIRLRQVWVACDTQNVPVGMVIAPVRDGRRISKRWTFCRRTAGEASGPCCATVSVCGRRPRVIPQ